MTGAPHLVANSGIDGMRIFPAILAFVLGLSACGGDNVAIFNMGNGKICVPNSNRITPPYWAYSGKGYDGSVAFSGCGKAQSHAVCSIPPAVSSGVLLHVSEFPGWEWSDFDESAYYKRATREALNAHQFEIIHDDEFDILKIKVLSGDTHELYWLLANRASNNIDISRLLATCTSSYFESGREVGLSCDQVVKTNKFVVKYSVAKSPISVTDLDAVDKSLLRALVTWSCK